MSSDAADVPPPVDDRPEWGAVRLGLAVVAVLGVTQLVGWGVWSLVHHEPTAYDRTVRCLTTEKSLSIRTDFRDPIAHAAAGGTFHVVIEGNGVSVSLHRSEDAARRTVERYEQVAGPLTGRLVQRWLAVYLFDAPYSPTQLQTLIDCEYAR